ncbi:substrate-binding domain-containing protein [Oscillibacter sp.]|uniref:sugar ABC transporter substrate-binding protein n=1 Tax=Oscillibacter sp. TaxID=1945593 RepID=UPI002637A65D|nr:substrate-binding domain-containing protein [Oscillibacter sp.]MDD3347434.1 substrate-binding domain-containing protein [Oscillibacter sp.]
MKMKKSLKALALALALVMTMSLAGCGSKEEAPAANPEKQEGTAEPAKDFNPEDYYVAICMDNMNHPVHRIVQLGFLKAAEALGYTNAKVIGTEGGDTSEAFAAAEAFAAEGGNGLLLWSGDSSGYETIASCASQGVVVGIPHFNHKQADGKYPEGLAFNMACDPTLYGKQVAELMAKNLDGKSGSVALTQNTKNVTENAATDSFRKTWDSLNGTYDLGKITVLDVQLEGGVVDAATATNLAIIQAHSDIIGAFGTTGNSPITWADAATKAGKADGEIFIVGMDSTEANLDYLEAGKVQAIVAQPLYDEAYKTMEYLDTIFRGGTVPEWTDLEAPVVTADGEGKNGMEFHREIAKQVQEFFK